MLCKEAIMDSRAWRKELRNELVRQELPLKYIERLVEELSDHFNDITEESTSMEAKKGSLAAERMGQPSDLATAAATGYYKRVFSREHPVLVFAWLPILLLPVLWAGLFVAECLICQGMGDMPNSYQGLRIVGYGESGLFLVPPAVIAVMFCRFARRNGIDWRWPMLTTGILAVFAGLVFSTVIPSGPNREPVLGFCVGLPVTVQQLLQSMLIFAFGGWCCWRGRKTQIAL
jgi:hypothetical protein